jgi:Xaa-Pro aminopeptidase
VPAEGKPTLYIDPDKLNSQTNSYLEALCTLSTRAHLQNDLKCLGKNKATILVDKSGIPYAISKTLEESGSTLLEDENPIALPRARKNKAELEGMRQAHKRDGKVMTEFLSWLDNQKPGTIDEITAVKKLEEMRRATGKLRDIAFETIAGTGPNGAIVHYRVTEKTNRILQDGDLFLIDSGAQYQDGTTDITRTVPIGNVTDPLARKAYTLVLKAHITLAKARFPKGTTGAQLDGITRACMWRHGLEFDHGTGHGVGAYLGVHEGPVSISKRSKIPLEPGMVLSNEPGFYLEGSFGIRIENLIVVTEPVQQESDMRPMMGFETITPRTNRHKTGRLGFII